MKDTPKNSYFIKPFPCHGLRLQHLGEDMGAKMARQFLFSSNMHPFYSSHTFFQGNSLEMSASLCLSLDECLPPASEQ